MDRTRYRTRCRVKTVVRSTWTYLQVYTGGHDEVQGEDSGKSIWTYLLVSTGGQDEVQGADSGKSTWT